MALILGLDLETTGFDFLKDRITEVGAVLWDTDSQKPLVLFNELIYEKTYPKQSEEVIRITGITDAMLETYGADPRETFKRLANLVQKYQVEYIVAHNGNGFDDPFLREELKKLGLYSEPGSEGIDGETERVPSVDWALSLPWIDTRLDLPFEIEPDSRKLKHLALDCGFINPFSHRALFDVVAMLKVLSHYDFGKILEYKKVPWIVMRAVVSFNEKELAKGLRYSWEKVGEKTYPKFWVKRIKENQRDQEIKAAKEIGFQSVQIE